MLKKCLQYLKTNHLQGMREQKGQSLIIFVFAILGLIAMMGLALDLGLVYIERVRVSRTTDAAALAAVVELPFEEEAIRRAVEFIELNGYTQQDTEIRVRGCIETPSNGLRNVAEDASFFANAAGAGGEQDPDAIIDNVPGNLINGYTYQPSIENPPRTIFVIDTLSYQPFDEDASGNPITENKENCDSTGAPLYGTANKLRISGQANVTMNFMQFFGFGEVPVSDRAVGENVTNLDVVVVFDVSGSMLFESNCFGCWQEDTSLDVIDYPYPGNGSYNPLDHNMPEDTNEGNDFLPYWGGASSNLGDPAFAGHNICEDPPTPNVVDGYDYFVHEAEYYSRDVPLHGWEFDQRDAGQGFWVLQRMGRGSNDALIRPHPMTTYSQNQPWNNPQLQGGAYNHECFIAGNGAGTAAYSGACWANRAGSIGEFANSTPPFVEYDFTVDWAGDNTHIWIRAQGGSNQLSWEWYGTQAGDLDPWQTYIYWQVDDSPVGGGEHPDLVSSNDWGYIISTGSDLPSDDNWRWVKIANNVPLANGQHTLRLFQGSTGFYLDKIIVTNNPDGAVGTTVDNNGNIIGGGSLDITGVLEEKDGAGPDPTAGSATREACNMCNPAFGQTVNQAQCSCKTGPTDGNGGVYTGGGTGVGCTNVFTQTNQLENDLFHGVDPLRSAQEAVKNFAARLDAKFDQIGVVAYSSGSNPASRVQLQCLRYAQKNLTGGSAECFDPGFIGGPISYTNVIRDIEDRVPGGGTNIAQGMREGLEELGIEVQGYNTGITSSCVADTSAGGNKKPCDRRGAARRVLILMTDGSPNANVSCPGSYNWRGKIGANDPDYDCALYFAQQAAQSNVILYTIGIGSGVNRSLLTAMAEGTDPDPAPPHDGVYFESKGGKYFPAAQPDDLDAIFEQILNNIFVRIVG